MPNSKKENQNSENENLKKEPAENKPKKAAEKNTQNKKSTPNNQKENSADANKKPAQKKPATDKKTAQGESTSSDKKTAQKKSAAAEKKPVQKKAPVKAEAATQEPKSVKTPKAAKPQETKKAEVKKEAKEKVVLEEVEIENGEVTEEDVLIELFSDKDNEEINEELENIKSIIQEDVNKIIEDSNGAEWSEIVKQSRDAKDENIADDDEDITEETAEGPAKYNYLSYFAIALFLIAFISVVYLSALNWKPMNYIIKADNFDSSHKLTSAITQYENAVSEVKNNDGTVTKRLIKREIFDYYKLGINNYSVTSSLINKYYSSKDLKHFWYRDISKINDEFTIFENTAQIAINISSSVDNYKDYAKQIDKDYKKSPAKYDQSFIEYYKYLAADYYGANTKTQIKHLKKAESTATSVNVLSLYYEYLAKTYVKTGDYDKVLDYTEKMLGINEEDLDAYALNANVYRLQKQYVKALKECDKGLKISSTDSGINQQMAIILILQGNYSSAEDYAAVAYKNASSSDAYYSSSNVYALCAYLNNDETTYEEIKSEIVTNYSSVADDIASIISGSKTIKEVFLDKDGAY